MMRFFHWDSLSPHRTFVTPSATFPWSGIKIILTSDTTWMAKRSLSQSETRMSWTSFWTRWKTQITGEERDFASLSPSLVETWNCRLLYEPLVTWHSQNWHFPKSHTQQIIHHYIIVNRRVFNNLSTFKHINWFFTALKSSKYKFECLISRRTVQDKMTGADIRLSDEQVELVRRLQQGKFGDVNFNEYEVFWVCTLYFWMCRKAF